MIPISRRAVQCADTIAIALGVSIDAANARSAEAKPSASSATVGAPWDTNRTGARVIGNPI